MHRIPMMVALALVPVVAQAAAPVPAADPAAAGIRAAMLASAAGWNAGDLNRFMAIYAPDAIFVGKRGLIHGKLAIADSYRRTFTGSGNSRGTLRFDFLEVKPIGERRILFARWILSGGAEDESGMTTLVFERRTDGWKIVSDHSS